MNKYTWASIGLIIAVILIAGGLFTSIALLAFPQTLGPIVGLKPLASIFWGVMLMAVLSLFDAMFKIFK